MKSNKTFALLPIAYLISSLYGVQAAETLTYPDSLLQSIMPPGQEVDTSYFKQGFEVAPGYHRVDLYVNNDLYRSLNIEFRVTNGKMEPVLRVRDIKGLPLKDVLLAKLAQEHDDKELYPLSAYIPDAGSQFSPLTRKLNVSIPQIYMLEKSPYRDVAPQALWDNGIPMVKLNYSISGTHIDSRRADAKSSFIYANLAGQANFGPWRLYTNGSFSASEEKFEGESLSRREWNYWNTYLQRDINPIGGLLQMGDVNTSGEIFDSFPMRGVRLTTNTQMIPYVDREYSPIIEGVANSAAQVIIRQHGNTVYTTNVSAGPFRLEKLPSFGSDGDLEVVIRESDGTERVMIVPYSSVPMMVKEGQWRYDVNVGRYYRHNMPQGSDAKPVAMGTLTYGLMDGLTLFGGGLIADGYNSFALGTGLSLGRFGAVALDVTQSHVEEDPARGIYKEMNGAAWRVRYQKSMVATGTTINIANYQYRTGNYATFNDVANYEYNMMNPLLSYPLKSRWQLSLTQNVGDYGYISAGGTYAQYRHGYPDMKTFNIGYSTNIKGVGVYLNFSKNYENRSGGWEDSSTAMLNLSIPFDLFFSGKSYGSTFKGMRADYSGTMQDDGRGQKRYQHRASLSGHSDDLDWTWGVSQTMGRQDDRDTAGYVAYNGDQFNADLNITRGYYNTAYQAGLRGSLIAHSGGITPSAQAYDSLALIEVPDVGGVRLNSGLDTTTDRFGYAVVPYVTNYTKNEISIDPSTLPEGVMLLDHTDKAVYPTAGAVVKVTYPVRKGHQAVFELKQNGQPLPFATRIVLMGEDGKPDTHVRGIVGDEGRIFLNGLPQKGKLRASWVSGGQDMSCEYDYSLSNQLDTSRKSSDGFIPVEQIFLDDGNMVSPELEKIKQKLPQDEWLAVIH